MLSKIESQHTIFYMIISFQNLFTAARMAKLPSWVLSKVKKTSMYSYSKAVFWIYLDEMFIFQEQTTKYN